MLANKQYKVFISEEAKRGLGKIVRSVALNSVQTASKLRLDIVSEIKSLESFPERYPFLEGDFIPFNKYHKLVIRRNYLVIYQVKDCVVNVDYVVDCRQDYQWLIR
ncbi:MAG: type II toxin-antitoxin system RelE/ParE family toxin [Phascolarctobacterium sp.]|nr:type II toxin-antitoxin system RelE/ParE family toxin [Phascolarctobacterium sp.]